MTNSFHNIATSARYQNAHNLLSTGKLDVVTVYVENISDKPFWSKLLNKVAKDRYKLRIHNYHSGKPALLKLLPELNENLKLAIDADLDYLFPIENDPVNHDHVLHTFAYSRESILLETSRLELFFDGLCALSNHKLQYAEFMKGFSEQCYCALLALVKGYLAAPKRLENYNAIFDALNSNIKVNGECIAHDQPYDINLSDVEAINYLDGYSVNADNAYRYINGHCLEKIVGQIDSLHQKNLLGLLNQDVRNKYQGEEIGKRCNQNQNILKESYVLKTHLNSCEFSDSDEIIQLIIQKIQKSFAQVEKE